MTGTNPYPQPQQLTAAAVSKLRGLVASTDRERQDLLAQRATYEQQIEQIRGECESITTLCAELDATATRYRARLRDAGEPLDTPSPDFDGPQTGMWQAPELARDPDAALRPRPSQARDQIPAPGV
ncbi:hypothetical protein OIE66_40625 [Nonomuraea sp. NBC_01738]|uniref:hypothetical protein n=1 Tax=Nonomuraea sp. NBC_01738 TaxID=2976003 RepID=UPI002E0F3B8F|nr:hypothetical protein OIE66_40625 [Nonomuraea sp. NBC_01738]